MSEVTMDPRGAAGPSLAASAATTGGGWVGEDELRDLLVTRLEVLDEAEFGRARTTAARLRIPLERALADRSRVPFDFLLEQLAQLWGVGFIDLKVGDVQPESLQMIPEEFARTHLVVPFEWKNQELKVAMGNPRDRQGSTWISAPSSKLRMWSWQVAVPRLGPWATPSIIRLHEPQIPSRQSWSKAIGTLPAVISRSLTTSSISRNDMSVLIPRAS